MKKQITRISILQSSKIVTVLYFLFGLIYWIPAAVILAQSGGNMERVMGGVLLLGMPVVMAIAGFLIFGLVCAVYNLLAKVVGGIEFEVKEVE